MSVQKIVLKSAGVVVATQVLNAEVEDFNVSSTPVDEIVVTDENGVDSTVFPTISPNPVTPVVLKPGESVVVSA